MDLEAQGKKKESKISTSIETPSYEAYLLMATSNVFLVIMQIFFKKAAHYISPFLILASRSSILFLYNIYPISKAGLSIHFKDPQSKFDITKFLN